MPKRRRFRPRRPRPNMGDAKPTPTVSAAPPEPAHAETHENQEEQEGKPHIESSETESQEETSVPAAIHGDIRFPLVSSHLSNGRVRTAGVLVTRNGCGVLHTDVMPKLPIHMNTSFGVERIAPKVAAVHRGVLRHMGTLENQRKAAEAVCIRARQGDQNAMAMIAAVRESAQHGSPQAISSFRFMQNFVQKNPVKPGNTFGEEWVCMKADCHASTALANGPPITNDRLAKVIVSFGADDRDSLVQGLRTWQAKHDKEHEKLSATLSAMQQEIVKLGRTIGAARALQVVRLPHTPIQGYDAIAAWELGE